MKGMKTLVKKFERYCKKEGKANVAIKLGYKDVGAINAWIQRKQIAKWQVEKVRDLCSK